MPRDLILAIDNGTQSVRALIFDSQGNLVAKARVPLEAYVSPQPGWAEQDPEYYWDSMVESCQRLWKVDDLRGRLAGVALTTQRSTVINVDESGRSLRLFSG